MAVEVFIMLKTLPLVVRIFSSRFLMYSYVLTIDFVNSARRVTSSSSGFNFAASAIYVNQYKLNHLN